LDLGVDDPDLPGDLPHRSQPAVNSSADPINCLKKGCAFSGLTRAPEEAGSHLRGPTFASQFFGVIEIGPVDLRAPWLSISSTFSRPFSKRRAVRAGCLSGSHNG
jgi:hypothetical protein